MARWLGVDAGAARVGLALSDPAGKLAMPLATLDRRGLDQAEVVRRLVAVVREHEVGTVVVGLPLHLNGAKGAAAAAAEALADELSRALNGEPGAPQVKLQDERGSTVQAHGLLRQAGRSTKRHRPVVDQVAAVVILQAALDNVSVTEQVGLQGWNGADQVSEET
ncbi:MAG: Holliday junction resolvase RuvX [Bifidobacteriaceae bacterium]|jgi:putative Holliday junction resolvase|nr:Holliday junction resolvase RuvX [Bifidobacteriaceae bacterium]